jgi:hypothetical protein
MTSSDDGPAMWAATAVVALRGGGETSRLDVRPGAVPVVAEDEAQGNCLV